MNIDHQQMMPDGSVGWCVRQRGGKDAGRKMMDMEFFGEAMKAVGLKVVIIDEPSAFEPLHPTLRKCKCGYMASSHMVTKHIEVLLAARRAGGEEPEVFWSQHGEVPLNQAEGETWQNAKWLKGTPKGYNE